MLRKAHVTQQFTIRQIYLKDLSFQAPSGASIFTQNWAPKLKVDMQIGHGGVADGLTEVSLTLSVLATNGSATAFMAEVVQAGVFQISGYAGDALEHLILGKCPNILLPYAREAIDAVIMKARFPALLMDPIDFEARREAAKAGG